MFLGLPLILISSLFVSSYQVFMMTCIYISRVSDQNGVCLLYIMLEIHHSGWERSNFVRYLYLPFCYGYLSACSYQVYVMTPMCLVEAVKRGEVKVTDFSLFVLDECHHTSGKHDFKLLMDEYMDCKFTTSPTCLPQVSVCSSRW